MLKKKQFLFFGADPVMGFVDPGNVGTPLAPMVELEEFERWAADQGWEYDINHDDGMLLLNNVTGLDPRTDRHYNTNRVDVQIEPDVLDTEYGSRELYDLAPLAEAGWVFSLDDRPQPVSDNGVLTHVNGYTYKLNDGETHVWVEIGGLSVRLGRYPEGGGVTLEVYEAGKENDNPPLSGMNQGEVD